MYQYQLEALVEAGNSGESANNKYRGLGPAPPGRTSKEVPAIVKIILSYVLICVMQFTGALLTVVPSLVRTFFDY